MEISLCAGYVRLISETSDILGSRHTGTDHGFRPFVIFSYRYLKAIDKFNERFISAYLTAGNIKLLLLHDAKSEDAIRNFFNDCYELYIKVSVVLPGQ